MKFVKISSKRTYVCVQYKKNSNLGSYNIIEGWSGEVFWVVNIIIIDFHCYLWCLCRSSFDQIRQLLWVLEVLCCLFWHNFFQMDHGMLWSTLVRVNWLTSCQEWAGIVSGPLLFLLYTSELIYILENKLISYSDDSTLIAVVPSHGVRVAVVESLWCDLIKVSEWCDLWGMKLMKLNASKTKTMIVSWSPTMHPQSPAFTNGRAVLKESDTLLYWDWFFLFKDDL